MESGTFPLVATLKLRGHSVLPYLSALKVSYTHRRRRCCRRCGRHRSRAACFPGGVVVQDVGEGTGA